MNLWERLSAMLSPGMAPLLAKPVCLQNGGLRAYIWSTKRQFNYEVVNARGEKLWVGTERDLNGARIRALRMMGQFLHRQ